MNYNHKEAIWEVVSDFLQIAKEEITPATKLDIPDVRIREMLCAIGEMMCESQADLTDKEFETVQELIDYFKSKQDFRDWLSKINIRLPEYN